MLVSGVPTWKDSVTVCDSFHGVNVTAAITPLLIGAFGIAPRFLGIRLRQSASDVTSQVGTLFSCRIPGFLVPIAANVHPVLACSSATLMDGGQ